jgi:hypothetical protein
MSGVTKGFVIFVLCKRGLTRDVARHLVRVHLQYYWPPADIPLIRRGQGGGLLFGNGWVDCDMGPFGDVYCAYWSNDGHDKIMCYLCGRWSSLLLCVTYGTEAQMAECCPECCDAIHACRERIL